MLGPLRLHRLQGAAWQHVMPHAPSSSGYGKGSPFCWHQLAAGTLGSSIALLQGAQKSTNVAHSEMRCQPAEPVCTRSYQPFTGLPYLPSGVREKSCKYITHGSRWPDFYATWHGFHDLRTQVGPEKEIFGARLRPSEGPSSRPFA